MRSFSFTGDTFGMIFFPFCSIEAVSEDGRSVMSTTAPPSTPAAAPHHPHKSKASNAKRRKAEDKMAMIFVAIVTAFLVTNFPRIFLNFHEVVIFNDAMACSSAGMRWAIKSLLLKT